MSRKTIFGVLFCTLFMSPVLASPINVFINELHYDNVGSDLFEAVELAGQAGTDISGWQLMFYNGGNGSPYDSLLLDGVFSDMVNGFGFLSFDFSGIQNGAPDGIALISPDQTVYEFISYEGIIDAVSGPAAGLTSIDLGVAESSLTPSNHSLYLTGYGYSAEDFSWVAGESSFGTVNRNQYFATAESDASELPMPGALLLMVMPLLFLWMSQDKTCLRKRPV